MKIVEENIACVPGKVNVFFVQIACVPGKVNVFFVQS